MEQLDHNLLFRWFVGMPMDEPVWDHRVFSKNRERLLNLAQVQHSRTHLALAKDAPEERAVQPAQMGAVVELGEVGGLHHRYERRAA